MTAQGTTDIDFVMPPVTSIRRYRYRPGDRIIVRINQRISMDDMRHALEIVSESLGVPQNCVLILDHGDDIKVMRNTQETAEKRDA